MVISYLNLFSCLKGSSSASGSVSTNFDLKMIFSLANSNRLGWVAFASEKKFYFQCGQKCFNNAANFKGHIVSWIVESSINFLSLFIWEFKQGKAILSITNGHKLHRFKTPQTFERHQHQELNNDLCESTFFWKMLTFSIF